MKLVAKENMSLMEALGELSPQSSKTTLRSWIKEGRVNVDGLPVKKGDVTILEGQQVELGSRPRFAQAGVRILYDDQHLVIIDKPSGILSVSTAFEKGETAHAFLKAKYKPRRVHVVHRLDQDTSGVMLFAFTEQLRDSIKKTFEKHEIDRIYYAVVEGSLTEEAGTWKSYLYEDANYFVHSTQDIRKGVLAVTHYKVKARSRQYTLLELKLETGRKNQIRVHCQAAGHPVAGDKKYGAKTNPLKRLGLHAHLLGFKHPVTGKDMSFESPIPEAFKKTFSKNLL